LRWREEQARVERLKRLETIWRRNQGLPELMAAVRSVVGKVDSMSEVGKWLSWAETYANRSDPLNRFRKVTSDPTTSTTTATTLIASRTEAFESRR
jgi:hypothetical protein